MIRRGVFELFYVKKFESFCKKLEKLTIADIIKLMKDINKINFEIKQNNSSSQIG